MSWLYVPGLEDLNSESMPPNHERGESVTWRGKPMQPRTWSREWKTGGFIQRLSGLTWPPSTLNRGVERFIASLQETPASPTVSPAVEKGQMMTDGCLTTFSATSIACGLIVSSGKTCRGTQMDSSLLSSRHWKEWVTALRQEYSARPKLEPATGGNGCSLWPTANVPNGGRSPAEGTVGPTGKTTTGEKRQVDLGMAAKMWPTTTAIDSIRGVETNAARTARGANTGTTLNDAAGSWGTPRASDGEKGSPNMSFGGGGTPLPAQAAKWTTPVADDTGAGTKQYSQGGTALSMQAANWPTPGANDHKGSHKIGQRRGQLDEAAEQKYHFSPPDQPTQDGQKSSDTRRTLNPLFTEWLMGWPAGWTDCERAVTEWSRWQQLMRGSLCRLLCSLSDSRDDGGLF